MGRLSGSRWLLWIVRVWWAGLPLVAGPGLGDALHDTGSAWRTTASLGLWGVWAMLLVASLLPLPSTLVAVRLGLTAATAATAWSWAVAGSSVATATATAGAAAALAAGLSAPIGQLFVNGISYGDELRLLLRPPTVLLFGPLPLAAAAVIGGVASGPLLLADERWTLGATVTVVGWLLAVLGGRSLYSLCRRWLVFVPAGVVLHDHLTLRDPVLVRRNAVSGFGPAAAASKSVDLTAGAAGLILELRLRAPLRLILAAFRGRTFTGGRAAETPDAEIETLGVLVAPSQPGEAVTTAHTRRFPL